MKTESTMEMCSEWLHYADCGRNSAQMREYIYYMCVYIHTHTENSVWSWLAGSSSAVVPQNAPFCSLLK